MQARSLITSTSQSPPGVTPLSDEEYESNKKRSLEEINEEIARAERKKRRQSGVARRRRNRKRWLLDVQLVGVLHVLVTCVLSCYQNHIYLSGIRDIVYKNFGPGGLPQLGYVSPECINDIAMYDTCEIRRVVSASG